MLTQQLLNALVLGCMYALFALGLALVFGVLDILNLAHASVYMSSAMLAVWMVRALEVPLAAAVPLAILAGALIGVGINQIAFAPFLRRGLSGQAIHMPSLISSLALALVLEGINRGLFGIQVQRFPPDLFPEVVFPVGDAQISLLQLTVIVVTALLIATIGWMLQRTRLGRAIRAVAENPRAATRMGIPVQSIVVKTFFIASALGAVSGIFMGLTYNSVHVLMGSTVELKGFAVIILGGMGSLAGAVVASFILAVSEVLAVAYVSSHFRDMIAFGLLIVVLLLRPQGLFGRKAA